MRNRQMANNSFLRFYVSAFLLSAFPSVAASLRGLVPDTLTL